MRPLEVIYGAIFFILSFTGAFLSFQNFSAQLAARFIQTPFKVGTDRHDLLYNGRCIGSLGSEVTPENHQFVFRLTFSISNGSAILPINVVASCETNQLDQITDCGLNLNSDTNFIAKISLSGPAPIKATVASAAALPIPSQLTFPGPIELVTSDGVLRIKGLSSTGGPLTAQRILALTSPTCTEFGAININEFTQMAPAFNIKDMTHRLEQAR